MTNSKSELFSWIKSILFSLLIVFICRHFIFEPVTVKGESMEPTFENHDKLIISKTSSIERFDLIVFNAPDEKSRYIKRVIGVPGDFIEVKNNVLYLNGIAHDEPYLNGTKTITWDFNLQDLSGKKVIPKGYFFVLGDNRQKSKDSRIIGLISEESVVGEVKFRFYPFEAFELPE